MYRLTLILIRHGVTAWNRAGRLQGQTDIPLDPVGIEQAQLLGQRLRGLWANGDTPPDRLFPPRPARVYSSDLRRAHDTATIALGGLPIPAPVLLPDLRERHFGQREGLTEAEMRERFGANHPTESETDAAVHERVLRAVGQMWDECRAPTTARPVGWDSAGGAVVFGHGGSLRVLLGAAAGHGAGGAKHFHLDNTAISIITFTGPTLADSVGRVLLANDTAHLHGGGLCGGG